MTIRQCCIRTRPVHTFSPQAQVAFAAVCQHIDWLFAQVSSLSHCRPRRGSASWVRGVGPKAEHVLVKAVPWDGRIPEVADLAPAHSDGVVVLVRNDDLTPTDMQAIRDVFGRSFFACPCHDTLYSVRPHPGKDFQLLLFPIGRNGCDYLGLPGVCRRTIGPYLDQFAAALEVDDSGEEIRGALEGLSGTGRDDTPVRDHDSLHGVLKGMLERAQRA